jgi:hypothetical protein
MQQDLVGRRPFAAFRSNSMSSVIAAAPAASARWASTISLIPVVGSSLTTSWFGSGASRVQVEAQVGGMLEDEPQLRLGRLEALSLCG